MRVPRVMLEPLKIRVRFQMDSQTGRPLGDHGTANDAIEWMFDHLDDPDPYDQIAFLEAWREGSSFDDYPEFYTWLQEQGR